MDFSSVRLVFFLLFVSAPLYAEELEPLAYGQERLVVDLGVGLWAWPLPMDFDGDGDLDLVVSCPDKPYAGIHYFENRDAGAKLPVFEASRRIGPPSW